MKVESISIKNFKRFERLEVSFKNQTLDVEDVWTWLPEWQQLRNLMAQ